MDSKYLLYLLLLLSIFCTSLAQVFQKKAAMVVTERGLVPSLFTSPYPAVSFVLLASGMVFWLGVLRFLDVSVAYPILAINTVLVLVASRYMLKEHVPVQRWIGAFSIVVGVALLLGEQG